MAAVPANRAINLLFQDNRGFKSSARVESFEPDISANGNTLASAYTEVVAAAGAVAAMSNTKLVRIGFAYEFDYAQEPSTETGSYELVIQKAKIRGGDGSGGFSFLDIPGPKDAIFLTAGQDNLIVVNPASSLITAFQASVAGLISPRGGTPWAQFFGGQLVQGKPRRRRVVQGA